MTGLLESAQRIYHKNRLVLSQVACCLPMPLIFPAGVADHPPHAQG